MTESTGHNISDSVPFVINGVRGSYMRTGNRGTSTWVGEPETLAGSDNSTGLQKRARLDLSEMRDRINILGRRNSISEGFETGNHT